MKKQLFAGLCIAALAACSGNPKEDPQVVQMVDSLTNVINQRDNALNDILATMNEVEEGIRAISEAEGRVTVAQRGEGASSVERIKENMAFIQEQMQKNRQLVEKLQAQLKSSNFKSKELQKAIDALNSQIVEKDKQIESLLTQLEHRNIHIGALDKAIDLLHDDVDSLKQDTKEKASVIADQDKQIHKAWYVFGTKSELKEQGIVDGGGLFSSEKVLEGNFNREYFTEIDIRKQKVIQTFAKSAEILTSHPAGSYTLQRDENKQYVLTIDMPDVFWGTSKYLVIKVK